MQDSTKGVLLIVDDEPLKRVTLQIELSEAGYSVFEESDANAALKILDAQPVDVVITDLRMPGMDGLQFLEKIKSNSPQTHVILMTAYGSIDSAVEAIKRGAYDYLTKPFRTELLLEKVDRLLACSKPSDAQSHQRVEKLGSLATRCAPVKRLFERINTVADNERPILIQGEAGTGKKEIAETLHKRSRRSEKPMITFSCDVTDHGEVCRDLFGEMADQDGEAHRPSCFEQADGGTLFLKNIATLPPDLQLKLLHVVEQKAVERSGQQKPVDVRIICSTRRDLRKMVDEGGFREDLYFLLCAVTLSIPPLRDRREDIPVLADLFLKNEFVNDGQEQRTMKINPHAMDALVEYHWPGNVRELEHVIQRAVAFADGREILPKDIMLPIEVPASSQNDDQPAQEVTGLTETIAGVERTLIHAALRRAAGNQAKAAQLLRIPRTTLRDKMTKYDMFQQQPAPQQ
jgi:DNA-binding NtrC family response regulator